MLLKFQSAPPHGGRRDLRTRPANPRPRTVRRPGQSNRFNPRPRTGGDVNRVELRESSVSIGFQSAPPHGGRPISGSISRSIDSFKPPHGRQLVHWSAVSIRAPARGATPTTATVHQDCRWFQSAPPHGGRPFALVLLVKVSIRAPARGATFRCARGFTEYRCFNPRPRTGGDRSGQLSLDATATRFNPRPRTGGDL